MDSWVSFGPARYKGGPHCRWITGLYQFTFVLGCRYAVFEMPHSLIVPALSILGINTFLSSALTTGSVFKISTIACQGGSSKGSAVGIAESYVGLGSGLYVAIFESLRKPGETNLDFLPMAAFFCAMSASLPGFLFLPTEEQVAGLNISRWCNSFAFSNALCFVASNDDFHRGEFYGRTVQRTS